jgi:spore germination protein YaaH
MAYDFHWAGGTPGPVAPIDWQSQVMHFTTSRVAPRKVELGVPGYGYNWGRRGVRADSVTFPEARRLARRKNATIHWSSTAKSPHFTYRSHGVRHEVWFMNARAVRARLGLMGRYRLAGLALWALGYEDPKQWADIRAFATSGS